MDNPFWDSDPPAPDLWGSDDLVSSALSELAGRFEASVEEEEELPADWMEKHYLVPSPRDPLTGEVLPPGPILFAEHQRRIINEALSKTAKGALKYVTVLFSAPKKSGKSAIASGVGLYMARKIPYAQIYCLANDGKSSRDRLYGPMFRCLMMHKQRQMELKNTRVNLTEAYFDNFSHVEAIPCDAAGEAGSEPTAILYSEFWGFDTEAKRRLFCYDEKTEILTRRGWLRYDQCTIEDELATLNPITKELEWQKPISVHIFDHTGEVYAANSRDMSIVVTEGHRFFGTINTNNQNDRIRVVEDIAELSQFGFRVATSHAQGGAVPLEFVTIPGTDHLSDLAIKTIPYLRLLGWYLSEGWIDKKSNGYAMRVNIAQAKNSPYYFDIQQAIENCGLNYTLSKDGFRVNDVRLANHFAVFGLAGDKYIPQWIKELPPAYIWHLLCAYHGGDGGKTETTWTFFTTSLKLKDDLTEIGMRLGARVNVNVYQPGKENHAKKYRVVFSYFGKHRYVKKSAWNKQLYKGRVWCPSVPNGIVFVRRNESYYFGGNTEMTIPPTLWGKSIRWIESYAGYIGVSNLLWEMYQLGVKQGVPHPDFLDLVGRDGEPVVWVNESAKMLTYWDTVPRMIWQTDEYYQQEARILDSAEFQRVHQNQWVSSVGTFVEGALWDACQNPDLPALPAGSDVPVVIAVDAAISGDCAAIVAVTRDPFLPETDVAVRYCKVIKPKPGKQINIENDIGYEIRQLAKRWNVVCVAYDAYQMESTAQNYRRGAVTLTPEEYAGKTEAEKAAYLDQESRAAQRWFYKFGQNAPRGVADKRLFDMITTRQVHWNPNDQDSDIAAIGDKETLTKHIKQAGAKTDGKQRRIEKLADDAHIDAAVALAMAADRCMELNLDNRELVSEDILRELQKGSISYEDFIKRMEAARIRARVRNE